MKEVISKCVFWAISIGAIFLGVYVILVEYKIAIGVFVLGVITNPLFEDCIQKKWGKETSDYFYGMRLLLTWCGIFVAFIIAMFAFVFIYKGVTNKEIALQNFEAILKIMVYIIYIIVLFMYKSENKFFRYIIFGVFYFVCVILSFSSQDISENIIKLLNHIPGSSLEKESYGLLINDFIMPIKEAILTYIIFDTVIMDYNKKTADKDNKINKRTDAEDVCPKGIFAVKVFDKDNRKNTNYNIHVKKR